MKCSTTGPGATVTSAVSVRRPSNRPRREDRKCLLLWGQSTFPASSGKTNRSRLNRDGDRAMNNALHIIAIGRLRTDEKTK
ncbi:hypothetical protein DQY68_20755 [Salmonella enterica subsp. salamae]|nr:hypothetical protein [Salmonella enterica subsp. salamae]